MPYLIEPVTGGGFALSTYKNDMCPLLVVQVPSPLNKLPPVTFSPASPVAGGAIKTSTNLNIKYSTRTSSKACQGSSRVWRLLKRITEARFVSDDGVEGNPSSDTLVNWFTIEKSEDKNGGYKLRFCPTEICKCSVSCSDLGIYVGDDKKRYLGLGDKIEPISVVFKRA